MTSSWRTPFGNVRANSDWIKRIVKSFTTIYLTRTKDVTDEQLPCKSCEESCKFQSKKLNLVHQWKLMPECTLKYSFSYFNGTPWWTKVHVSMRSLVDTQIKTTDFHAPVVPRRAMGSCSSNLVTKSLASSGGASSSLGHSITPWLKV